MLGVREVRGGVSGRWVNSRWMPFIRWRLQRRGLGHRLELGQPVRLVNGSQSRQADWFVCGLETMSLMSHLVSAADQHEKLRDLTSVTGLLTGCRDWSIWSFSFQWRWLLRNKQFYGINSVYSSCLFNFCQFSNVLRPEMRHWHILG